MAGPLGSQGDNFMNQFTKWFMPQPTGTFDPAQDPLIQLTDWAQNLFSGAGAATGQGTTATPPGGSQATSDFWNQILGAYSAGSAAGGSSASGAATAPAGYYTPDGVWIQDNTSQDSYYRMVDALYTKLYGQHPPWSMAQTFKDLGVENTSQLDTIMQQMPSHIQNPDGSMMSLGQYDLIKGTGNQLSDKYFGRPIPDALIKDWTAKGITDPESIELWFMGHPAKDIPKDVYGQIFDQAVGQVQKIWNDVPHPDQVHSIYGTLQPTASGHA